MEKGSIFYIPPQHRKSIVIVGALIALVWAASSLWPTFAADGSGNATVSPSSVVAGSTDNNIQFTFSASETMDSGELVVSVPAGWTLPIGTNGSHGYTTAQSTAGVVANVLDAANSTSGWILDGACSNGFSADGTFYHEGNNAIKCVNGDQKSGDFWYKNITSQDWSSYTKVGFWIYTSEDIQGGRLRFSYAKNSNMGANIRNLSLGNISKNTWTYVVLNLAGNRSQVASYGFKINNKSALILLVEDEGSVRLALSDKLKREGFEILEAKNGNKGLEIALEKRPSIILLDIIMPKMNGIEMLRKLREANEWGKKVPVIILTNLTADNDITWAVAKDEPAYYLIKSDWDIDSIVAKVKETLHIA